MSSWERPKMRSEFVILSEAGDLLRKPPGSIPRRSAPQDDTETASADGHLQHVVGGLNALGDVQPRLDVAEQVVELLKLGCVVGDADEELAPVGARAGRPRPLGIAALDHKIGHDAVPPQAIVEALLS